MTTSNQPIRTFRAPGKVVLLGEYAVVDGSPAIVAAVNRGVQCCRIAADELSIEAPGDTRFVAAALREAPIARYVFSDYNPTQTGSKVGMGGSAAAVVVALASSGLKGPESLFRRGLAVHREVQGSGSGIDVAASSYGGVLRFQQGDVEPCASVRPIVVWSGNSAKTGPRVERYLAWEGRSEFIRQSTAIVGRFQVDPVGALREGEVLLSQMASEAGISYLTPALQRISSLAQDAGGAAKPSGAGGGDCAVALFHGTDQEEAFCLACQREGFAVIPVDIALGAGEVLET